MDEQSGARGCPRWRGLPLPQPQPQLWPLPLAMLLFVAVALVTADYHDTDKRNGVCRSLDLRNNPQELGRLSGCRVIEGLLHIVLMENINETHFNGYSFPNLTEITGYLLIYRIQGLKSLSQLFPNLLVIRGQELLQNYALIIFDTHLEDIGLHSLTEISRGSVRIENNRNLCYVKTINWKKITKSGSGSDTGTQYNIIDGYKTENECSCCNESCKVPTEDKNLCWNKDHCQKICPDNCTNGCTSSGVCCDASCIGGCSSPKKCFACKNYSIGYGDGTKCVNDCPNGFYKYQHRCVTETECRMQPRPPHYKEKDDGKILERPYKLFNKSCILECPPNYTEVVYGGKAECKQCNGPCRKECNGTMVDSIQSAQRLRGCTVIKNDLIISVRPSANIIEELEAGLGAIEEIEGSLKITRSYPLVSLSFLKSLRVIVGKRTSENNDNINYSLQVTINENLEELWDWDKHPNLTILHGSLQFHYNPKLCYDKILKLKDMTVDLRNASDFKQDEVSRLSNGDKIACNVNPFTVTVLKREREAVQLLWPPFKMEEDTRYLLGYTVYIMEAPNRNVTRYEGQDACRATWRVEDLQNREQVSAVTHAVTRLKPYTQYAFYVKTYLVSTVKTGGLSPIDYFTTLPGRPSEPALQRIESADIEVHGVKLRWSPPDIPNGNITHYHLQLDYVKSTEAKTRNYCLNPPDPDKERQTQGERNNKELLKPRDQDTCKCESTSIKTEDFFIDKKTFEDALQNIVFTKRTRIRNHGNKTVKSFSRYRRMTNDHLIAPTSSNDPVDDPPLEFPEGNDINANEADDISSYRPNVTDEKSADGYYTRRVITMYNKTDVKINYLRHYGTYEVSLWACRELDKEEPADTKPSVYCSQTHAKKATFRTNRLIGADLVSDVSLVPLVNNSGKNSVIVPQNGKAAVWVYWKEPQHPNGPILTYSIKYQRVDIENHVPLDECISRAYYLKENRRYKLENLQAGNYSIRVMTTSLGGPSNYSEPQYILIEEEGGASNASVVAGAILGTLAGIALIMLVAIYVRRRLLPPPPTSKLYASVNPEYVSATYEPDEWEITRDSIEFVRELGQGSFGMVYEGIATDVIKGKPPIKCAVKTVNEHATDRERIEFLNEASVMKAFDTAHVVHLLGVVSRGQPTLVVMELMEYGDLKSYLRSHRPDAEQRTVPPKDPPTLTRIMRMAMEIADGMAYLAAKKFVHRDLAARNCMVAGDLTVKVGDFGMTRDIYETDYYRKGSKGLLPVRWMSPESLKDGVFTSASDVWSYGIVLWEMATLAMQPYQGLSNEQVLRYVIDGGVMERPENCPDRLYELMRRCWAHRASQRPSFLAVLGSLERDATEEFRSISFYHSAAGREAITLQANGHGDSTEDSEEPDRSGDDASEGHGAGSAGAGGAGGGVTGSRIASWARQLAVSVSPGRRAALGSLASLASLGATADVERARSRDDETRALVDKPPPSAASLPPPNGLLQRRDISTTGC